MAQMVSFGILSANPVPVHPVYCRIATTPAFSFAGVDTKGKKKEQYQ